MCPSPPSLRSMHARTLFMPFRRHEQPRVIHTGSTLRKSEDEGERGGGEILTEILMRSSVDSIFSERTSRILIPSSSPNLPHSLPPQTLAIFPSPASSPSLPLLFLPPSIPLPFLPPITSSAPSDTKQGLSTRSKSRISASNSIIRPM